MSKTCYDNQRDIEKSLVLYAPVPTPRWTNVIMAILFLVSMGLLSTLYDLPSSRFPYHEAGYAETYDMKFDGHGIHPVPSGEWEWLPGGSSATLYQTLIPSLILICFSFQIGRVGVVGQGWDVSCIFCLGCICLICYCIGWLIQGHSALLAIMRIGVFAVAGGSFVFSIAVSCALSYTKLSYQDPVTLPLVLHRISDLRG